MMYSKASFVKLLLYKYDHPIQAKQVKPENKGYLRLDN